VISGLIELAEGSRRESQYDAFIHKIQQPKMRNYGTTKRTRPGKMLKPGT
jgi:hypothetical protein